MAKKKILKLNDEQYYKYILSLKNDGTIKDEDGQPAVSEPLKKSEDNKTN